MTLCGVLKDILLVAASMLIFRDPVSGLQFFGYSIALAGLVYYKLGGDKMKDALGSAQRSWAEFGANRPAARKMVIFGTVLFVMLTLLAGIGSTGVVPAQYTDYAKNRVGGLLNGGKAAGVGA
jgi:hypothetical protein